MFGGLSILGIVVIGCAMISANPIKTVKPAKKTLECAAGDTQIISPEIAAPGKKCADLIAQPNDYYNIVMRKECQRWLGLNFVPQRIQKMYIYFCVEREGTAYYKADVCCEGSTSEHRCFTCVDQTDLETCNHQGTVESCAAGEVCQTTFNFENGTRTFSKQCSSLTMCSMAQDANSNTCRSKIPEPQCTYCCGKNFCNYHTTMPLHKPGNACQPNRCQYGGRCVLNSAASWGYDCECPASTWSKNCAKTVCDKEQPCKNYGFCTRIVGYPHYKCDCRIGWHGYDCDKAYSKCTVNVCKNGGTCYTQEDGFRCQCPTGWFGVNCEQTRPVSGCPANRLLIHKAESLFHAVYGRGKSCTDTDHYIRNNYQSWFTNACIRFFDSKFVQGVNGLVEENQAINLHVCERGDVRTWYNYEICCAACLANPCQNGGWCMQDGNDYICRCRHGYEGKHCEFKATLCTISGDPHYRTFDGQMIHYQGKCEYQLVGPETGATGIPEFLITMKNEVRSGNPYFTYPKYIEVTVNGYIVRIDRGPIVFVNGVDVTGNLPISSYPGFELMWNGIFIRLETDYSLVVEYDGKWTAIIKTPSTMFDKIEGLCGNYDGDITNDLTTRTGTDVSNDPNKFNIVGDSWVVNTDPLDLSCPSSDPPTTPPPSTCTEATENLIPTDDYCGLITDVQGVFKNCIEDSSIDASMYYDVCRYDVCATNSKDVACLNVAVFATMCRAAGYEIEWRNAANCPMTCGSHSVYSYKTSACPATCQNPLAPASCSLPTIEDCVCEDGYIRKGSACVSYADCGCMDEDGNPRTFSEVWFSDNCTKSNLCAMCTAPCDSVVPIVRTTNTGKTSCDVTPTRIDGNWGSWNSWSNCAVPYNENTQSRYRECNNPAPSGGGAPCDGDSVETRDCSCRTFVPEVDCLECVEVEGHGYVPDPCDPRRFYQCVKRDSIWVSAFNIECPPCLLWDQEDLTCGTRIENCTAPPRPDAGHVTIIGDICVRGARDNEFKVSPNSPYKYLMLSNDLWVEMACPTGTKFNFTACICAAVEDPCESEPCLNGGTCTADRHVYKCKCPPAFSGPQCQLSATDPPMAEFCITADLGPQGKYSKHYVGTWDVAFIPEVGVDGTTAIEFDGSSTLSIPFYNNNYRRNKFSISFFYRRTDMSNKRMGLVSNTVCEGETPSILLEDTKGSLSGTLKTDANINDNDFSDKGPAKLKQWHHVVYTYNGASFKIYLDNKIVYEGSASGKILNNHCALKLGHSTTEPKGFFKGFMDEIYIYHHGLTAGDVDYLYKTRADAVCKF